MLQPIEQGLANPVRRRPQAFQIRKATRRPRHMPAMMRTELRPPAAPDSVLRVVTPGYHTLHDERSRFTPRFAGFSSALRAKLNQGPAWLTTDLAELIPGRKIDAEILDELETRLITADVGMEATQRILEDLRRRVARKELGDVDALLKALHDAMVDILKPVERPLIIDPTIKPYVILVVGINGAGKTTTIGKLAHRLLAGKHSVLLASRRHLSRGSARAVGRSGRSATRYPSSLKRPAPSPRP